MDLSRIAHITSKPVPLKLVGSMALLALLFSLTSAVAGDLLVLQNFESPGWESQFTGQSSWGDNITRTSNAPASGNFCLRWNQDHHRTDPITNLVGIGNSLLDWRGGIDLVEETPHELYFSMKFRHDDYANDARTTNSSRKLFYIVDDTYNVGAMYIKFQLGTMGLHLSYANGAYSDSWARANWGYAGMDMRTSSVPPSTDGIWHTIDMYWNYESKYVMMWLDGNLLLPQDPNYHQQYPEQAAAGQVIWDPNLNLHTKGIQIMYYDSNRDLVNGADESGYYSGVQIDDLEFWTGIPGESNGSDEPGVPGQPQRQ